MRSMLCLLAGLLLVLTVGCGSGGGGGARYVITRLPLASGYDSSQALDINNSGQIVGSLDVSANNSTRPALWQNGQVVDLGALLPANQQGGMANQINDAGQVVGVNHSGAFLYTNSQMTSLPTLVAYAAAINASGLIAGGEQGINPQACTVSNGNVTTLSNLGGASAGASDLNDAGQVVGYARTSVGVLHAVRWLNGQITDLQASSSSGGGASAINTGGQVVGYALVGSHTRALLWQNNSSVDLGTITGFLDSSANAINDAGQIVGTCEVDKGNSSADSHAFLWESGSLQDLNTLIDAQSGWVLTEARGINRQGQIVGRGRFNGTLQAFLLTPR